MPRYVPSGSSSDVCHPLSLTTFDLGGWLTLGYLIVLYLHSLTLF